MLVLDRVIALAVMLVVVVWLQTMSVVTAVVRGGTYEGSKNSFDT